MSLKRLAAPAFWPIEKKTKKFVVRPRPGPHPADESLPLGVVLRDVLGYARGMEEARSILNAGLVSVDGVVRRERGFPVGLMDIVSVGDEHYRIVPYYKGIRLVRITESESNIKLLRIENKNHVSGRTQLNFHDGKNLLVDKDSYHTGDVAVFDLNSYSIKHLLKLEKGSLVLLIGGNNVGSLGRIEEIIVARSSMPNQVVVSIGERRITLPKDYVFVVGAEKPAVKIGDGE